jgi:AraC-like DNA-binding protein
MAYERNGTRALHLLSDTDNILSEESFESGFENSFRFSCSFRQHFGLAPTYLKQQISS